MVLLLRIVKLVFKFFDFEIQIFFQLLQRGDFVGMRNFELLDLLQKGRGRRREVERDFFFVLLVLDQFFSGGRKLLRNFFFFFKEILFCTQK